MILSPAPTTSNVPMAGDAKRRCGQTVWQGLAGNVYPSRLRASHTEFLAERARQPRDCRSVGLRTHQTAPEAAFTDGIYVRPVRVSRSFGRRGFLIRGR